MRGLVLIALPMLAALLGATLVLIAYPQTFFKQVNRLIITKVGWAYDQFGKPLAVLDVKVEGEVTLDGIYLDCLHKTVYPKVGLIAGDYGKIRGALDPYDPLYPGVLYVEYNYTIAMGRVVWLNVGMGKVETHVLLAKGRIVVEGTSLTLYSGDYVLVLRLPDLLYGSWCSGEILLKGMRPVAFTVVLK